MSLYVTWSPLAIFVLAVCSFAFGYIGGVAFSWGLRRSVYRHECDIAELQGRLTREVKLRASEASKRARSGDSELLGWAETQVTKPDKEPLPSVPPFHQWWRDKMKGSK